MREKEKKRKLKKMKHVYMEKERLEHCILRFQMFYQYFCRCSLCDFKVNKMDQ
jgi:hypothetical protein